jgi:hypothetical protein
MWEVNVQSAALAAHAGGRFLEPGGMLTLTGAAAAFTPGGTPGMSECSIECMLLIAAPTIRIQISTRARESRCHLANAFARFSTISHAFTRFLLFAVAYGMAKSATHHLMESFDAMEQDREEGGQGR